VHLAAVFTVEIDLLEPVELGAPVGDIAAAYEDVVGAIVPTGGGRRRSPVAHGRRPLTRRQSMPTGTRGRVSSTKRPIRKP